MLTPAQKLIADADAILKGNHSDPLLDWRDAAQMYQAAGEFGLGEGYAKLASMYRPSSITKYFKENNDKALSLYKKAVSMGYYDCLPAMAGLYIKLGEIDRFLKMWDLYISKAENGTKKTKKLLTYVSVCLQHGLEDSISFDIEKHVPDMILLQKEKILEAEEWLNELMDEIKEDDDEDEDEEYATTEEDIEDSKKLLALEHKVMSVLNSMAK